MRWQNLILFIVVTALVARCGDPNTYRRESDSSVTEIVIEEPVEDGAYLIYNWHGTFTNTSETDTLMFEAKTNEFDEYVEWPPYVIEFVVMPEDANENPIDVHGASFILVGPYKYDKVITFRTPEELETAKRDTSSLGYRIHDYDEKIQQVEELVSAVRYEEGNRYEEDDLVFELVDGRIQMTVPAWFIMPGKTISVRGHTKILSPDQVFLEQWEPIPVSWKPYRENPTRPEWLKVEYGH